jgi:hypothetical protein
MRKHRVFAFAEAPGGVKPEGEEDDEAAAPVKTFLHHFILPACRSLQPFIH